MTESEIIQRGRDADRICSDPTYQAAWDAIMRDLFKQWAESPLDDVAGRERLRLELDVLTRLKGKFLNFMNEATVAKATAQ
ncbi:hypothetical protein [Rhizobium sp. 2MFCol3.1]|uniref:hypothetical protein n=1 Tax=Rhizobium sp. 2MFCol3.1 TaxID=1246459 RepID=UPI000372BD7E|nr:hypothetical protein [Rhizobium sp. 2MFCol3.1]